MANVNKIVSINRLESPTEAHDRILRGVNFLADAVKLTLGPYGRNFLLEKGLKITNDGISIAKEIQLKDEIEDLGLRVAREAAVKTNDEAGDGTTTVLTLLQAIIKEGARMLPGKNLAGKKSVIALRRQIAEESKLIVEKLKAMATPVNSKEELIEVARVSVEDEELAKLIGSAQWDLGPNGTLLAEESNDLTDSVERLPGIRFDNGFGTSSVINNQEKQRLEVDNVKVIFTNHTIQTIQPLKPVLDELVRANFREIAIVARAFTEEAIRDCIANHKIGIKIYPINAPYLNQSEIMRDLQSVIGGRYLSSEDSELSEASLEDVGTAQKILCQRYSAVISGKKDEQSETRVSNRVKLLEDSIRGEESVFQKKAIEARIAQLKDGLAVIRVGALTEQDRKYKYDKVEDAVNAVKAALQEGTVPGAGLAFKQISEEMPEGSLLKKPLLAPYQQIMANAGETFEVEKWVRNPLKVDRVALINACSIAADLLTAGGAVANEKPKQINELLNRGVSQE